ncbi:MAG: ADP-forming succinate--CoA ligase subunit beta [Sphaerochaetaceae bacterium]
MKIHEYQAKELLREYGAPVGEGIVASTALEASEAARKFGKCVIKAQVYSGARGKAGGVKIASSPEEAFRIASDMIGMTLVTKQTGPEGKPVHKVLVSPAAQIQKEMYLSVASDNENAGLVIIASSAGGTEIEQTACTRPQCISKIPVSIVSGFRAYEAADAAKALGLSGLLEGELSGLLSSMVRLFLAKDCSLVEINPLVVTDSGHLLCLDAKINFDDNALYRHPDIVLLRDIEQEDAKEYRASQFDLNYVSLDGDIGCMVNGAGLAMATMDIIKNFGGKPANFLDVGGSATAERVKAAFEILLSDTNVKAIFVNIFGGIMKCDVIAQGVVAAVSEMGISIPLVVRLEGTNVELGRRILNDSGLSIVAASDMADGARKAIALAKEAAR